LKFYLENNEDAHFSKNNLPFGLPINLFGVNIV